MAKDKAKGGTAHKGFGFVVYKDAGSAAKATKAMHGKELQGRMVEVRAEAAAAGTKRVAAAPAAAAPGSAAKKAKSAPAQSSSPITALGNTSWTGMITHSEVGADEYTLSIMAVRPKGGGAFEAHGEHVMLSYEWSCQETVKRIRSSLAGRGYRVWLDIDCMSGSTMDAMSDAVDSAAAVCYAVSPAYKEVRQHPLSLSSERNSSTCRYSHV